MKLLINQLSAQAKDRKIARIINSEDFTGLLPVTLLSGRDSADRGFPPHSSSLLNQNFGAKQSTVYLYFMHQPVCSINYSFLTYIERYLQTVKLNWKYWKLQLFLIASLLGCFCAQVGFSVCNFGCLFATSHMLSLSRVTPVKESPSIMHHNCSISSV